MATVIRRNYRKEVEEMGEAKVRHLVQYGIADSLTRPLMSSAVEYLAEIDEKKRLRDEARSEAWQAQLMQQSQNATRAAWIAAAAAVFSILVTIALTIVWDHPRHR
jgi:hypothetical protein